VFDKASTPDSSNPGTEPFVPDFDTGEDSVPFVPNFDDTDSQPVALLDDPAKAKSKAKSKAESKAESKAASKAESKGKPEATSSAAEHDSAIEAAGPVTVPGRYQYVKWWKLVLVLLGVWLAAAQIGLSLFYWWFHTINKTGPVFMVLVYVVACSVAGVMLAMVEGRPLLSALALAVMSGPFASVAAAAPLYGYYSCERLGHCLVGIIPY
jgi:hypothetical protein